MKLWDFVKRVGAGAIREAVPGGGLVIDLVNGFLPDDGKLPAGATGEDAARAIDGLPPEQRAGLQAKELDIRETEIREAGSTLRAALDAEARSPHTTRPRIALGSFRVLAAVTLIAVTAWAWGIVTSDEATVKAVADGWPFLASVVAPFVVFLRGYFGVLQRESRDRLTAAGGSTPGRLSGIVGSLTQYLNRKS